MWALQDAKSKFSQLVRQAQTQGPQSVSVRGKPVVVVISLEEYQKKIAPRVSLTQFIQDSPLVGLELDLSRDRSLDRDLDL